VFAVMTAAAVLYRFSEERLDNYLIQIIPMLVVAPQFIRGNVEFGTITQSAVAFTQLLGAFSLIVTQFAALSSFAAVVARLAGFAEVLETMDVDRPAIETVENGNRVAYEALTLRASQNDGALLTGLSVSIPRGMRVLVTGPNEAARLALFRATAGIWSRGEGRIVRPPLDAISFLPQQPYLTPGTLRHLLVQAGREQDISDERILSAVRDSELEPLVERVGGLDVERDWPTILSLGERQQLAIARLILARPSFAILDRVSTALGSARLTQSLQRLTDNSIAYMNFDEAVVSVDLYDAVLEIDANATWNWTQRAR
jgi:putative ATP-binding cassette transporter